MQTQALVASGKTPYALVAQPLDLTHQKVDLVQLDENRQPLARGSLPAVRCARLHAAANGSVVCLSNNHFVNGQYQYGSVHASGYDRLLSRTVFKHQPPERGQISRARISADGQSAAWTYFVRGHSYLDAGSSQFSMLTQIASVHAGGVTQVHNLEAWTLKHKGQTVKSPDLNYWGVTFHPSDSAKFLVTAFYKGKPYLAQGNVRSKTLEVIHAGVECPSYSPDGSKIAFKKRVASTRWAPATLELANMQETVFSHLKASVDDQIDWLDAHTLLFEVVTTPLVGSASVDLMTLNTLERKPQTRMWLANARSAAVYLPPR